MPDPIPIPVANLLLDSKNPRLPSEIKGQRNIIHALAKTQWNKLLTLARDIVEYGRDPSDLFLVMRQKKRRYVVLDGNRRIAVLKLLDNPSLLDRAVSASRLQALKSISEEYDHNLNDEVLCIQVRSRTEADHWIDLKHTSGHEGAGPERWSSEEGGRFQARVRGTHEYPETQALDFLQQRDVIDQEARSAVPTTTLRRLLGTPTVRDLFGVGLHQGALYIASGREDDVAQLLHHVIADLTDGRITARDLNLQRDRISYAESLPRDLLIRQPVGPDGTRATEHPAAVSRVRRSQPTEPNRLITGDVDLHVSDRRLQNIEQELRKLSLSQYPNAISVLFRVFLELSANDYVRKNNLNQVDERTILDTKLKGIADSLAAAGKLTRQETRAIEATTTRHRSIFRMNQSVHNQYLFPSPGDLRAEWRTLQPWFGLFGQRTTPEQGQTTMVWPNGVAGAILIPMPYLTPLRYPGSKRRLSAFVAQLLEVNLLDDVQYVEPCAGGASIALMLLYNEYADSIYLNDLSRPIFAFWSSALHETERLCLNDLSRPIFAFWSSALHETERLCAEIEATPITMEQWELQKAVYEDRASADLFTLGFATFFLNRTNRSGIISGGVIGGKGQDGDLKLNAPFQQGGPDRQNQEGGTLLRSYTHLPSGMR